LLGPPPHPVRSTRATRAHDSMLDGWSGGEVGRQYRGLVGRFRQN
jgi:hypothetical protein